MGADEAVAAWQAVSECRKPTRYRPAGTISTLFGAVDRPGWPALGPLAPLIPVLAQHRAAPVPTYIQPRARSNAAGYGRRSPAPRQGRYAATSLRKLPGLCHGCRAANRRLSAATLLPQPAPAAAPDHPRRSGAVLGGQRSESSPAGEASRPVPRRRVGTSLPSS